MSDIEGKIELKSPVSSESDKFKYKSIKKVKASDTVPLTPFEKEVDDSGESDKESSISHSDWQPESPSKIENESNGISNLNELDWFRVESKVREVILERIKPLSRDILKNK